MSSLLLPTLSRVQPTALLQHRTVSREDLHQIAITGDPQPQGPPTQHLQLQSSPPHPQISRAQSAALLHHRTMNQEDLHPLAATAAKLQQHDPDPQPSNLPQIPARGGPLTLEPLPALELNPSPSSLRRSSEDLHLTATTKEPKHQGPPTQHLQLWAQLQCSPPQPQRGRAQPAAPLHHCTMYKEDLHLISGITEDSQSQGPPTQHLQLQAQLQCSARQPQQLPTLVSQPQVQPAPTNRDPQDSRAQPSALLYHSTMSREDLHLIDVTKDSQPQDPTPQLQIALNYLEPREDPHLITITKNTGEPSPGPSSPQRPPEPQLASITLLLPDPMERGPLAL